jgi:hypothetical protein
MTPSQHKLYRLTLGFFIFALVMSGVTAFPLLTEIRLVSKALGISDPAAYASLTGLQQWFGFVHHGLEETYAKFPFIGYGTDWLAFGHIVIAMFFVGPWRDPMANRWVLKVGLLACACVLPLAWIAGEVRSIPWMWRWIDCSFGIFGALPLLLCLRLTRSR